MLHPCPGDKKYEPAGGVGESKVLRGVAHHTAICTRKRTSGRCPDHPGLKL